ncbi:fasciclin-like arabinogalactan protein 1 [Capsicum chacoense]
MQLPSSATVVLSLTLLLCATEAHNITHILAKHPQFSTFNHYLTTTHLAVEINRRQTITVCVVDNAGMSKLLSKHLSNYVVKNVLSFHVLLDYFSAKKLHQITNGTALAATIFQATGSATGSSGFVNITDLKGGKVGFSPADYEGPPPAKFVKSIKEIPYNISVIQISMILPSADAEAPSPGPIQMNLTTLMSAHGCKVFAETLLSSPAENTFEDNVEGGLTIFCPGDDAMKKFLPKFQNLSAEGKQSLLEYHGVPIYQSISNLKSNNGGMNTLATDGGKKYALVIQNEGEDVTVKTTIVTAKITGTLIDQLPLAIFSLDKVLLPKELFKAAPTPTPTPAPAPAPEADSESPKHSPSAPGESPADSPADGPSDDDADSGAVKYSTRTSLVGFLSIWLAFKLLM